MESTTRLIVAEQGLAGQQGAGVEETKKEAWLDHNGQASTVISFLVAGLLLQILSSDTTIPQLGNHLPYYLIWLICLAFLSNRILAVLKRFISGKDLSLGKKIMYIGLNLLAGTEVTSTNVAFLCIVDKSYLSFALVPVLQFVILATFGYKEQKSNQNQELQTESMVKNCFNVAKSTTSACYAVQAALIFGYLKNPNLPTGHLRYTLVVSFLTSVVGQSAMIITSSPLDFKSDMMHSFLKIIRKVMPFLVGVVAAILSAAFLDATMIAFAVVFPFVGEFVVILCQDNREEQATEDASTSTNDEIDSTFEISIAVLCAIYATPLRSEKHSSYLTWSVFFFLLVIISNLIRMAFPRGSARSVVESIIYSSPELLSIFGVALLSAEMQMYIKGMNSAGKPSPSLGLFAPLPH